MNLISPQSGQLTPDGLATNLSAAAWGARRRSSRGLAFAATVPLQSPSLEHFDARVTAVVADVAGVEGLQPTTRAWAIRSYRSFRRFLKASGSEQSFLDGDVRAQVLTLQRWVAWLREAGLSRGTINSYWRGLASISRWIQRREGTIDPFAYAPTPGVGQLLPRCLPRPSAERLLAFVHHYPWRSPLERTRSLAIVGLMLLAGLRRGEVLRLGFADLDLDAGTIRIVKAKGLHGGKDRTGYVPEQLREILAAYLAARQAARRTHPELITSLRANSGISATVLRNLFRTLSRESGIHVSPHMLRHTYATLLRQAGAPDRLLMELLGHTSVAMTYRYAHVYSSEVQAEAQRLKLDVRL
jgi:integrase/recombinase XerC